NVSPQIYEVVGDRWSLLVIHDPMDGERTFTQFQRRTGIAATSSAIASASSSRGLPAQRTAPSGCRREYVLTGAGRDLFPSS
ncbi:MAG: winged helix-turn-helix transcriptional regulator, partial [Actinomadura rubrobrunea]|nr:winged helix-turn-helix transcriptional regulator [Actinomadura rubrobrunea]